MRCGGLIEYVIPTVWERRYELVATAIAGMLAEQGDLSFRIREDLPSHASWFAGFLPALGFSMTPRVKMTAETATLLGHVPNDTAHLIVPMEPQWLESCIALYTEAYGLDGEKAKEMRENLTESLDAPDRRGSWFVALDEEKPIGSCFGSRHRDRLFIEELAVADSHRKRGLGRRLLLETVRKLPAADAVVLDVDRMSVPAVGLYTKLGFTPTERYTVGRGEA